MLNYLSNTPLVLPWGVGVDGIVVSVGGASVGEELGAQAVITSTANIIREKKLFFMFHSPVTSIRSSERYRSFDLWEDQKPWHGYGFILQISFSPVMTTHSSSWAATTPNGLRPTLYTAITWLVSGLISVSVSSSGDVTQTAFGLSAIPAER